MSVIELSVAAALLLAAMLTTGTFHQRMLASGRAVRVASTARSAVLNAREEIASWPIEAITEQRIEELNIDSELSNLLPQARWIANVKEIEEPIRGRQVFIDLQWQNQGQLHSTSGITFWIRRPATAATTTNDETAP